MDSPMLAAWEEEEDQALEVEGSILPQTQVGALLPGAGDRRVTRRLC